MTPPGSGLIVALRGATVHQGGRTALDGVDLDVWRGESIAVVGPNGAGKTTLLRALHGLVPLAAGERLVRGTPRIAMLFQRPFLVRASVRFNLELALWLAGTPRRERRDRAMHALSRVGLAAEARRRAQDLSIGQQQRLAFARALLSEPDLLLLDEPTAGLDVAAARDVETLVADIAARGVSVLLTSHDPGQVQRLARRVVTLAHGRVEADDDVPKRELLELPEGPAVPAVDVKPPRGAAAWA